MNRRSMVLMRRKAVKRCAQSWMGRSCREPSGESSVWFAMRRGFLARRPMGIAVLSRRTLPALWASCLAATALAGQTTDDQAPPDTYESLAVAELVRNAREARNSASEELQGYAAQLRHRIYVGLTAFKFRRERGLFEQQRIGRVRWWADGSQLIEWEGMRAAVPIAGLDTRRRGLDTLGVEELADTASTNERATADGSRSISISVGRGDVSRASRGMGDELVEGLFSEDVPAFDLDPHADVLRLEDGEAVHPLSADGPLSYRYLSGDTLILDLPEGQRDIVLHEVRVVPRRPDYNLLAASIWFDQATNSLVRATYRPARPFNMALDVDEEDTEGAPRWLMRRVEAEIHYVTVEYSLHHMEYWLPSRYAFRGEVRLGALVRIPATIEWSLMGYSVNDGSAPPEPDDEPPPGWVSRTRLLARLDDPSSRGEPDSTARPTVTVRVAPAYELFHHPELSVGGLGEAKPLNFSDLEVSVVTDGLDQLVPPYQRFRPQLPFGLGESPLRYNRVEGASLGLAPSIPLGVRWRADLRFRIGTGERTPYASAEARRLGIGSEWSFDGGRQLRSMADQHDPFRLASSLDALITGDERGEYYRATGISAQYRREGRTRWSASAFAERHHAVELNSEFSLRSLIGDVTTFPVRAATPGDYYGVRGSLRWFDGLDPNRLIVSGGLDGELATGDLRYARAQAAFSLSHPLPFGLQGAAEIAAGSSWGEIPVQRRYFLGSESFRGALVNEFTGESFWRTRGEIATGFAAARVALFADIGSEGETGRLAFDDPAASVGVGLSLLDGLMRMDVARGIRRIDRWRVHFYWDGLL